MPALRKLTRILLPALLLAAASLIAAGTVALADTWLCPVCQVQKVERALDDSTLTCPQCKLTLAEADLRIPIAYISVRTRPTEVVWNLVPECGIFRNDGLLAYGDTKPLWVPWSAVDYYIPRQRILRLTSGAELGTPYARGPECMQPPKFIVTVTDSVGDFSKGYRVTSETREEELSAVFIVARSKAVRDSARIRFIREVETGKHPRLPRSQPQVDASRHADGARLGDARLGRRRPAGAYRGNGRRPAGQSDQRKRQTGDRPGGLDRRVSQLARRRRGNGGRRALLARSDVPLSQWDGDRRGGPSKPPMWREWVEPQP